MPEHSLAGSRIRQRRLAQGLKQAELAEAVGISASYLNLIEHNRRRIGGKLLSELAARLSVDPALLADGAGRAVVARLEDVAERFGAVTQAAETADFAARFPDWASLVIRAVQRVDELERHVEALTDRLTHDPHLAASLHEVLSTVTALRSTAAILNEEDEIEPEWLARFHRNMSEDAARLADGAQALVGYLDGAGDARSEAGSPQEELMRVLDARGWYFAELEQGADDLEGAGPLSKSGRALLAEYVAQYRADAAAWPEAQVAKALDVYGPEPLELAHVAGLPLDLVLRRLATRAELGAGFVSCDASGTLLLRKTVDGFSVPRFGAACPLWPLFSCFARPMVPLRERLSLSGQGRQEDELFDCYAIALPKGPAGYGEVPLTRASMLMLPRSGTDETARAVGASCRICPRQACAARRELSILGAGPSVAFDTA